MSIYIYIYVCVCVCTSLSLSLSLSLYVYIYIYIYIPLFFHYLGCWMFYALLTTMHFHFIFVLTLHHVVLNHLTISSSHCCGCLLITCYWALGHYSGTELVHLQPKNLATYSDQLNFCFWYSKNPTLYIYYIYIYIYILIDWLHWQSVMLDAYQFPLVW